MGYSDLEIKELTEICHVQFCFFQMAEQPNCKKAQKCICFRFAALIHCLTWFVQRMFPSEQTGSVSVSTDMGILPFICVHGSWQAMSVPGGYSVHPDLGFPPFSYASGGKGWLPPLFPRGRGWCPTFPLEKVFFVLLPIFLHRLFSVVLLPPGTRFVMSGRTILTWRKAPRLL